MKPSFIMLVLLALAVGYGAIAGKGPQDVVLRHLGLKSQQFKKKRPNTNRELGRNAASLVESGKGKKGTTLEEALGDLKLLAPPNINVEEAFVVLAEGISGHKRADAIAAFLETDVARSQNPVTYALGLYDFMVGYFGK